MVSSISDALRHTARDASGDDIEAAERELCEAEELTAARLAQAQRQGEALARRLRDLSSRVTGPGPVDEPAYRELLGRVEETVVPRLDASALAAQQRQVRVQALQARNRVLEAMKQQVAAYVGDVARVSAQVQEDERLVASLLARREVEPLPPPIPLRRAQPAAGAAGAAGADAKDAKDKRQHERTQLRTEVDFTSESNFYSGFSTDVSAGGLFVATQDPPPIGSFVDVAFTLPNGARIEASGQVRWQRVLNDATPSIPPGVGVQFTKITAEGRNAIAAFVASRDPLFYAE